MVLAARIDEMGRPAWIALMVLSCIVFWPLGLAILAFMIGSGRMGCKGYGGMDRWQNKVEKMQAKVDRMRARMGGGWNEPGRTWSGPSSGNHAFDEYRTETLRRLEEEQREFQDFLERLRFAKDKAEFDQFMAERRGRGDNNPAPAPQG